MQRRNLICIVGDGPAGCAAALSLQQSSQGQSVDIVQICAPESQADAVGETIPPAATTFLSELSLAHILEEDGHLPCPGSMSCWGSEQAGFNDFSLTPVGRGYHLDRRRFNHRLKAETGLAGVRQIEDTRVTAVTDTGDGIELTLDKQGKQSTMGADFVVDATGLQARVARSLGVARNEYDVVLSICAFFTTVPSENATSHTLVCSDAHGWWYASRLPNQRMLVSYCSDTDTIRQQQLRDKQRWFQQWQDNDWFYGQCCEQAGVTLALPQTLLTRAAPSAILSRVAGSNWLAVGDAAASYDSMTSAGISKALQQGIAAGKAVAGWLTSHQQDSLEHYQAGVFSEFTRYLKLHQHFYHEEQRYNDSGFWRRRQQLQ